MKFQLLPYITPCYLRLGYITDYYGGENHGDYYEDGDPAEQQGHARHYVQHRGHEYRTLKYFITSAHFFKSYSLKLLPE